MTCLSPGHTLTLSRSIMAFRLFPMPRGQLPDCVFATDACLTGCGGICGSSVFHAPFPEWVLQNFSAIHQLEFLALLVAIRLWGARWAGLRVQVYCDNAAVVTVINSGKTSDLLMGTILRNTWLHVSSQEFEIRAVHLSGVTN